MGKRVTIVKSRYSAQTDEWKHIGKLCSKSTYFQDGAVFG
jgi:hypothetical protein